MPNAELDPRHLQPAPLHNHTQAMETAISSVDPLVHPPNPFPYPVYAMPPRGMPAAPPQTWQAPNGIAPQQTHLAPPPHMMPRTTHPYREDAPWDGTYDHTVPPTSTIVGGPAGTDYEYRYRDDQPDWVGGSSDYYDPSASKFLYSSIATLTGISSMTTRMGNRLLTWKTLLRLMRVLHSLLMPLRHCVAANVVVLRYARKCSSLPRFSHKLHRLYQLLRRPLWLSIDVIQQLVHLRRQPA
jgi:hypothetical protein